MNSLKRHELLPNVQVFKWGQLPFLARTTAMKTIDAVRVSVGPVLMVVGGVFLSHLMCILLMMIKMLLLLVFLVFLFTVVAVSLRVKNLYTLVCKMQLCRM